MPDTMLSLGDTLKNRRKELNLSIREVENATSIRSQQLQAIEEEQFSQLNSPIYARGFVKQYASFLGLDGDQLVQEYNHLFSEAKQEDYPFGIGTLEQRGHSGGSVSSLPNLTGILLAGAILGAAWFFARYLEVI